MTLPNQPRRVEMESYSLRNMYLSVLLTNLLYLTVGMTLVWTSSTILYLQQLLLLSPYQEACIAASCFFGAALGPAVGGQLVYRFGYKSVMLAHGVLYSASLTLLCFSSSTICLVIGRMVAGLATGMLIRYLPAYTMEIADLEVYSILNPTILPTQAFGYLIAYTLGPPLLKYKQQLWLYVSVPVVSLGNFFLLPESARFDVSRGKLNRAQHTISFLRRGISTNAAQAEVLFLQEKLSREQRTNNQWYSLFSEPTEVRALSVVVSLSALEQLSGTPVFLTLTQHLLSKSSTTANNDLPIKYYQHEYQMVTIIIGVIVFMISICVSLFTRNYSCKKILTCSAVTTAILMVVLGFTLYYTKIIESGSKYSSWILPSCITLHLVVYHIGFANICLTVDTNTVFSSNWKEISISTTMTVIFFSSSMAVFLYYLLDLHMGSANTFWIFAFFCIVTAIVSALFVPNTVRFNSHNM